MSSFRDAIGAAPGAGGGEPYANRPPARVPEIGELRQNSAPVPGGPRPDSAAPRALREMPIGGICIPVEPWQRAGRPSRRRRGFRPPVFPGPQSLAFHPFWSPGRVRHGTRAGWSFRFHKAKLSARHENALGRRLRATLYARQRPARVGCDRREPDGRRAEGKSAGHGDGQARRGVEARRPAGPDRRPAVRGPGPAGGDARNAAPGAALDLRPPPLPYRLRRSTENLEPFRALELAVRDAALGQRIGLLE